VGTLLYIRLIGFTAGTLLMLFWMVVILGYRRQRNFERVFFFLCLALFLFYSGSLLSINAQIYYAQPPHSLSNFAAALICLGLTFLPPLILHLHLEFAETRSLGRPRTWKRIALFLAYSPSVYFMGFLLPSLLRSNSFDLAVPGYSLGPLYLSWLFILVLFSCGWDRKFAAEAVGRPERRFHKFLGFSLCTVLLLISVIHWPLADLRRETVVTLVTLLALMPLLLFTALIYFVQRHNFLNIGKQKNLLYAVSAVFVALLYLALVRRISDWIAPFLPPEATAAILLFLLVIFIEPLQRILGRSLRETAQREMDLVQRTTSEIQEQARQGKLSHLKSFIERRVQELLGLRTVRLQLSSEHLHPTAPQNGLEPQAVLPFDPREYPILRSGRKIGVLYAEPHGAGISGDTAAALEFLCEQLPAAFDLCRLIEEKLRLERELAERERMAALGQMAASISHNLKNPLGSIKTILQVQIESRELPENFRQESQMVLEEVNRLSSKLNQLLQFSRPAILGQSVEARCDAAEVLREVTEVLRPEADRRNISLDRQATIEPLPAAIGKEALNDILTNLLVNALDAVSPDGHICVRASQSDGFCTVTVEDDGPGIPPDLQEKILQPFFTTKSQGTGLGLAIVSRRVAEAKGHLDFQSPVRDGRGTVFQVRLPSP
jgi:signal transduction histidine kinase